MKLPTIEQVKFRVNYNPESGAFTWNHAPNHSQVRADSIGNSSKGYKQISIDGMRVLAHRLAWFIHFGQWPSQQIDHINGDRSDNRIVNLRLADYRINAQNRHAAYKNNRTGLLGARWHKKQQKFVSAIRVGKRMVHLGTFDSAEDAQRAYHAAKQMHHLGYVPDADKPTRVQVSP